MRVGNDKNGFGAVMLPHMDAAYSLARYLTRNPSAADDIVQESYLRACRGFAGWRGDNPKAWLLMIVRRCFLDSLSRRAPLDEELDGGTLEQAAEQADPESALAETRMAAAVRDAVEALPRPYREAILLREFEALSYREMAAVVGVPAGTVMSRLFRARQLLADRLAPLKDADAPAPVLHAAVVDG